MTAFQWIVIPLLLTAMIATGVAIAQSRLARRWGFGWMLLWLAATIAVAAPELLHRIAHVLGIGRGADLALYASILFMFLGFFVLYLRYRRLADELTRVVRHIAITEALASGEAARPEAAEEKREP